MIKRSKLILILILLLFFLLNFAATYNRNKIQQENQPPVVKLSAPQNNSLFDWDTPITYKITVSDKEDGESKYDEINVKEVLLEVKYIKGKLKTPAVTNKAVQNDAPGLAVIRSSNCFNCHNFNAKSIGPSFYDISKRYPATLSNTDTLTKRIREGSSGLWVKEKMPSHPELTNGEIKSTVQWILKNGTDPNVNYYTGTEGTIRIKQPANGQKGIYVLTASYTDHGLKNDRSKNFKKGADVVVISKR
ncbi:MAG: c-type cytochrome [Mucilaginibacter sp.]|nr:c-type cytochrome [Mucilaginibacter sp.]